MIHVIGNADDFWRIRLTRLDTTENFDFEWHDDILYRQPSPDPGDEIELWHVEAVRIDDSDVVARLATCRTQDEGRDLLERIQEDMHDMTKAQFEAAYVDCAEQGDTGFE